MNTPALKRDEKMNLTTEVVRRLTTAIALGEYLPGSKLPAERQLSAILNVARVTVRAAIGHLVDLGLLEVRQGGGGGTFVVEPDSYEASLTIESALSETWERLVDLQEAEVRMHGVVAEAAAEKRNDADLRNLSHCLQNFREADSLEASQKTDEQFHLAIVCATHSNALAELVQTVERQLHVSAPAHPWGSESKWATLKTRSLSDHEEIFACIEAGDRVNARIAGSRHARINGELLNDALEDAKRRIAEHADQLNLGR